MPRTSGLDTSAGMEVLNTMTKIMDNLRKHGGIALHGVMGANLSVASWWTPARDFTKILDARRHRSGATLRQCWPWEATSQ